MSDAHDITRLLSAWRDGDSAALAALSPIVYDELRRIAGRMMAAERGGHTLQATALVNEAYLRLVDSPVDVNDRQHFFALAARIMRRALVDHARAKQRIKRGGDKISVTLKTETAAGEDMTNVLELDDALTRLEEKDPRLAQAVELVFFGGLSYEEAADELSLSRTSLVGELKFAKAWLRKAMGQ